MNKRWVEYGAPKIIGDKAYQDGVNFSTGHLRLKDVPEGVKLSLSV